MNTILIIAISITILFIVFFLLRLRRLSNLNCFGDILAGKPEALELLDERIKRVEQMEER